jgi:hypothetical protein
MLIGFFLFSGDQGGLEQKNRVRPYFVLSGSVAPRKRGLTRYTLKYHRVFIHASWAVKYGKGTARKAHAYRLDVIIHLSQQGGRKQQELSKFGQTGGRATE